MLMGGWLALAPPLPGVPEPLALLALPALPALFVFPDWSGAPLVLASLEAPALPAFAPLFPADGWAGVLPGLLAGVWGRTDALFSPRGA